MLTLISCPLGMRSQILLLNVLISQLLMGMMHVVLRHVLSIHIKTLLKVFFVLDKLKKV
jgi:hypothetical protein